MQPVLTPDEMATVDAAAPEPVEVLIERAAWQVARSALELLGGGYGKRVVVVAGPGNNGNDGRVAVRFLERRGARCTVLDPRGFHDTGRIPACDLVIDAAFGTGFRGEYLPPRLPDPRPPVLAVDIPSGISGVTGELAGEAWPADRTVTFAALKPGLLLGEGPGHTGEVDVVDIGLDVSGARAHRVEDSDVAAWLPPRPRATHKWRSAAWVVAGSPGMTGAAHLTTRSAQRAGAGYVRLSTPGADRDPMAPTEAVVTALPAGGWADDLCRDLDRFGAVAVGPGLGTDPETAREVRELVARAERPMVVDGDGLRALGGDVGAVIAARPPGSPRVVLTPHDGEWEALTGAAPGADRLEAVRDLAHRTGAVVLLKGPATVVAAPDGHVWVTTSGDARLATAGTGDVLTGMVAAFLAQGIEADRAAAAAGHLHGRAGALAWRRGLVASDVVDRLPTALNDICTVLND